MEIEIEKSESVNAHYGWKRDTPDQRDHKFTALMAPVSLPTVVDLRPQFPTVYDQGSLGSCTANSIAGVVEFDLIKQKIILPGQTFIPSRLFIYYNERVMEGTINSDAGAELRDGFKSINSQGVCSEVEWPYNVSKFAMAPPTQCYSDALKYKSVAYQSVNQDLVSLKSCLASGYGFSFGFTVYSSFESAAVAQTGIVPMPQYTENVLGGHAVVGVGYNAMTTTSVTGIPPQTFVVRNSWGPSWGMKGYCFMPFAYLTNYNLSSDFWKVTVMA
jgi:C1A family cysteine protease